MANCDNSRVLSSGILSKHELFRIIGDQFTPQNVKELLEKHLDAFPGALRPLVVDGYSFFLALDSARHVDTSDILKILARINRMDLAHLANYRRRKTVEMDPVDQYLEQTAKSSVMLPSWLQQQSPWVRCPDRCTEDGPSRPGPSHPLRDSSRPSTSQMPSTPESVSPSSASKSASGTKRKRRRGSLTYNKSHNRLKRSRTLETLPPVSQCAGDDVGDGAGPSSSLEPSCSVEQGGRRITRSRTRSEGIPSSSRSTSTSNDPISGSSNVSLPGNESSRVKQSKDCDYTKTKETTEPQEPSSSSSSSSIDLEEIKKKVTCDIRLRVRAEYCYHDSALDGNIFSNKPELIERQFEKFGQANTILKSRDLGSIICDIKFSELTYLDAFWRDYINGSLLEALKGVFITDSLKQAVGHEAIKLLVNVDEDDYESGRFKLLQNLKD